MKKYIYSLAALFIFSHAHAADWLTVEGRLTDATGIIPITESDVDFNFKVYSPDGNCLLFEEDHPNNDMSNTLGFFNLRLGSGSAVQGTYVAAMSNVNTSQTGFGGTSCPYTPASGDIRVLKISFDANDSEGVQTLSQFIDIGTSPYAHQAENLGGHPASDFLQVSVGATQANIDSIFDGSVNYAELVSLINGTSSQYLSGSISSNLDLGSNKLINVLDPTNAQDAATKNYVDTAISGNSISPVHLDNVFSSGQGLMLRNGTSSYSVLADGSAGQMLQTDGSGNLSWVSTSNDNLGNHTATADLNMSTNNIAGANNIGASGTITAGSFSGDGSSLTNISAGSLADGSVAAAKIAANSLTAAQIASGAITSAEILDGTIVSADLASNSVNPLSHLTNGVCSANEILKYNGSSWVCSPDFSSSGGYTADGSVPLTGNIRLNNNYLSNDGDAEGIRINNDGKVGVGTVSPNSQLHVSQTYSGADSLSGMTSHLNYTNVSGSTGGSVNAGNFQLNWNYTSGGDPQLVTASRSAIYMDGDNTSQVAAGVWNNALASSALTDVTNLMGTYSTTEIGAGNVTNAYAGYFSMVGSSSNVTNGYGVYIGNVDGNSEKYSLYAADSSADSYFAGNVGIGTTTPSANLDIFESSSGDAAKISNNGANGRTLFVKNLGSNSKGVYIESGGSGSVGLTVDTSSGIAAYFDGSVGIGTSTPSQMLEVSGHVEAEGFIQSECEGGFQVINAGKPSSFCFKKIAEANISVSEAPQECFELESNLGAKLCTADQAFLINKHSSALVDGNTGLPDLVADLVLDGTLKRVTVDSSGAATSHIALSDGVTQVHPLCCY